MYGFFAFCMPTSSDTSPRYVSLLIVVPASKLSTSCHFLYANSTDSNAIVSVDSYPYSIGDIVAGYTSSHFTPYVL
jgi:hypothetical protein